VFYEPTESWYVVPAHIVVKEVSRKTRGQHTENPFETATMNLNRLNAYRLEDASQLRDRTLAAIAESDKFPALGEALADVLSESQELASRSIDRVRQLLEDLGLD
jgi:hypothetical protein